MNWPSDKRSENALLSNQKHLCVNVSKWVQQESGWLRVQRQKREWRKLRDPGFQSVQRNGSREPGSQCPAGPPELSGREWRSCQGPDSVATWNGRLGRPRKGG